MRLALTASVLAMTLSFAPPVAAQVSTDDYFDQGGPGWILGEQVR